MKARARIQKDNSYDPHQGIPLGSLSLPLLINYSQSCSPLASLFKIGILNPNFSKRAQLVYLKLSYTCIQDIPFDLSRIIPLRDQDSWLYYSNSLIN